MGWFHVLAVGDNAAMRGVCSYLFETLCSVLLGVALQVGLLGWPYKNSVLNALRNCHTVSHRGVELCIPNQ